MKKLQILILEDEPIIADQIGQLITDNNMEVCGMFSSAEQALQELNDLSPDIALVDIHLKGNLDGIDFVKFLGEKLVPYIIVSAYSDEATLKKVNIVKPAGFLVKPFNGRSLLSNIYLAMNRVNAGSDLGMTKGGNVFPQTSLLIKKKGRLEKILFKEILFVKASSNYSKVITRGDEYISSKTLKLIGEKLPPNLFTRVHRSYIVNVNMVTALENGTIFLEGRPGGIPVGRSYRKEVSKIFRSI